MQIYDGIFLVYTLGTLPSPSNSLYWYLSANISGGYSFYNKTGSFVYGGPYGPKGEPLPPPHPLKTVSYTHLTLPTKRIV